MREHRRGVERNIVPALGSVRLDRLTAEHLDRFYRSLRTQGLGPASIRRHHAILSSALRRAPSAEAVAAMTAVHDPGRRRAR